MYDWDDLADELREDLLHDLGHGLIPATLALGYDDAGVAVALQAPAFVAEEADAIVRRIVDVFGRFPCLRRFASAWPVRFELPGTDGDGLRSADGGVWALLVTRGSLDARDRPSWRCAFLWYRVAPADGLVEVAESPQPVPIDALAQPYPRRLRAILDPTRHERALTDPYLDARRFAAEGYDLRLRGDLAATLVPVDADAHTDHGGRLWPRSALS